MAWASGRSTAHRFQMVEMTVGDENPGMLHCASTAASLGQSISHDNAVDNDSQGDHAQRAILADEPTATHLRASQKQPANSQFFGCAVLWVCSSLGVRMHLGPSLGMQLQSRSAPICNRRFARCRQIRLILRRRKFRQHTTPVRHTWRDTHHASRKREQLAGSWLPVN